MTRGEEAFEEWYRALCAQKLSDTFVPSRRDAYMAGWCAAPAAADRRGCFVIERHLNSRLVYWTAGARGRSSRDDWSEDFAFATRLADRDSADAVLIHLCGGEGRVAEHAMIAT